MSMFGIKATDRKKLDKFHEPRGGLVFRDLPIALLEPKQYPEPLLLYLVKKIGNETLRESAAASISLLDKFQRMLH